MATTERIAVNPMEWDAPFDVIVGALFVIVMCRANATYWVGRMLQRTARHTHVARLMETPGYERAVRQLNRWGPPVVSLSFVTIGFQTLVNLAAGATKMPQRNYLPAVTVGCMVWALMYGTLGYVGFESLALLWARNPALAVVVIGVGGSALTAFILWRIRASRKVSRVLQCGPELG